MEDCNGLGGLDTLSPNLTYVRSILDAINTGSRKLGIQVICTVYFKVPIVYYNEAFIITIQGGYFVIVFFSPRDEEICSPAE